MTKRVIGRTVIAAGVLWAAYGGVGWWLGERAFARMRVTTCTLVSKTVKSELVIERVHRGIGGERAKYVDDSRLVFTHTIDGRRYTFSEDRLPHAEFEQGHTYQCRYDPGDPTHGTLTTGFIPRGPVQDLIVGAGLVLLGLTIWKLR